MPERKEKSTAAHALRAIEEATRVQNMEKKTSTDTFEVEGMRQRRLVVRIMNDKKLVQALRPANRRCTKVFKADQP